jgi:protease-4
METQHEYPIHPSRRRRHTRWWIPLVTVLAVIVVFFVAMFGFGTYMISSISFNSKYTPTNIENNTLLKLDFSSLSELEGGETNPFSSLFGGEAPGASFYQVIHAIKYAATDPKIIGIYYEGGTYLSGAMQKELQLALAEFKKAKKPIYSYLETSSKADYYTALLSDTIFVPDEGMYEFSGYYASAMFPKGLYDKIGLQYDVVQCEDFKSAAETYKNTKFSDSARLVYKILVAQRENDFINSVSQYRNISKEQATAILSMGLLDADMMIENKLADVRVSKNVVYDFLAKKTQTDTLKMKNDSISTEANESFRSVSMDDYVYVVNDKIIPTTAKDKIAIIRGEGAIVSEIAHSGFSFNTENTIVSKDFVKLIEDAQKDTSVKGIILRVNSPGGSVIASEEIYQAVIAAKKVKPVYASMSNMAASGGYYISMCCDTIVADSATITGSIGVVAAFPNVSGVLKNLHVNVDTISNGVGNPYYLDPLLPRNEKDIENFQTKTFATYKRFVTKAAQNRKMSFDSLRAVAKGRVWLGKDAYERGLVDTLGNLDVAIDLMKKRIGKDDVSLKFYPEIEDSWQTFVKLFNNKASAMETIRNIISPSPALALTQALMLPEDAQKQLEYTMMLGEITKTEKVVVALPTLIEIK